MPTVAAMARTAPVEATAVRMAVMAVATEIIASPSRSQLLQRVGGGSVRGLVVA